MDLDDSPIGNNKNIDVDDLDFEKELLDATSQNILVGGGFNDEQTVEPPKPIKLEPPKPPPLSFGE